MAIGYKADSAGNGGVGTTVGAEACLNVTAGGSHTIVGARAGANRTNSSNSVLLGYEANIEGASSSNSVYIGNRAGADETTFYRMYIANSRTATPLLKGVFWNGSWANATLTINGNQEIILQSDAVGLTVKEYASHTSNVMSWKNSSGTVLSCIDASGDLGVLNTSPASTVDVGGSFATPITEKSGAYTITAADYTVLGDATSASFTVTLPTAAGITGRVYTIKKIDATANTVTVQADGSENIDAANTKVLTAQWEIVQIISDGTDWLIIN